MVGRTRVLLGPGGRLEGVLTAGEAVSLELRGTWLHGSPSQAEVTQLLAPYGSVKHVSVLRIASHAGAPDVVVVRVMMGSPEAAARAIQGINSTGLPAARAGQQQPRQQQQHRITAVPHVPRAVTHVFQSTRVLRVSWSSGVPGRCATVGV